MFPASFYPPFFLVVLHLIILHVLYEIEILFQCQLKIIFQHIKPETNLIWTIGVCKFHCDVFDIMRNLLESVERRRRKNEEEGKRGNIEQFFF